MLPAGPTFQAKNEGPRRLALFLFLLMLPLPGVASDSGVFPFHSSLQSSSGATAPATSTMILFTDQDPEATRRDSPGRLFGVACAHATAGSEWKMGTNELSPDSIKGSVTYPLCDLTLFEIDPKSLSGGQAGDLKPFAAIRTDRHEKPGVYFALLRRIRGPAQVFAQEDDLKRLIDACENKSPGKKVKKNAKQ